MTGPSQPAQLGVTSETALFLQRWRHHKFSGYRPLLSQVEAVETLIWLTEVAPRLGEGRLALQRLESASLEANPELLWVALKLATGAGKTTAMAMIIAWQTINAVRHPNSRRFTRGFLVVTPGRTIRDRLTVLQPNDPDSYYASRELVLTDMLVDLQRAKPTTTAFAQGSGCTFPVAVETSCRVRASPSRPLSPRARWCSE